MADIELNTEELIKYNEAVEFNAQQKNNFYFKNDGDAKALIVFKNIYNTANKDIQLVAKNLDNDLTTSKEYLDAIKKFLTRRDTTLDILLSDEVNLNNNLFILLKEYKSKICIKTTNGKTFKGESGNIIHFCVADEHAYRMEYDIIHRKAEVNFNDEKICSKLKKTFYLIFNNSDLAQSISLD